MTKDMHCPGCCCKLEMFSRKEMRMRKKMSDDEKFMKEALRQAKKAYAMEETPIGCVLVHEGKIIARGYNKRNKKKKPGSRGLAAGGMHDVCHAGTLPDVCRSDRAGKNPQSGDRKHESEGGMCRFRLESAGYAGV